MPRAGIIEVDRFLDQPQAEASGVEGDIPLGGAADRGDVVDACAGHEKVSDRG
jgi:hypothetical protein